MAVLHTTHKAIRHSVGCIDGDGNLEDAENEQGQNAQATAEIESLGPDEKFDAIFDASHIFAISRDGQISYWGF